MSTLKAIALALSAAVFVGGLGFMLYNQSRLIEAVARFLG